MDTHTDTHTHRYIDRQDRQTGIHIDTHFDQFRYSSSVTAPHAVHFVHDDKSMPRAAITGHSMGKYHISNLYGVVWSGVVWSDKVWCGVVWCDVIRCDVVWCGVIRCDVVWCGSDCCESECCESVCCRSWYDVERV